ncbi:hypothetical protein PybrP1_001480 [[Pythium] brassicae (nom. inval.)]|nr:hypothetical protein PybrP1_001480 [[Pythium] brassicae (nom. inval.)]
MNLFGDSPASREVDPRELRRDTNRAIRAILASMDNRLRFETPEELQMLQENVAIARKRAAGGLLGAGAVSGLAGALLGMAYGMFSVRQKLFLDLLSVPEEIATTTPSSVLEREIRARRYERFPTSMETLSEGELECESSEMRGMM